ncbi:hypothetical protein OGZ01_30535 (plasmid) [Vibrio harveyi]|nr:hypothetical protein [Vibrio harveyi]
MVAKFIEFDSQKEAINHRAKAGAGFFQLSVEKRYGLTRHSHLTRFFITELCEACLVK